MRASNTKALSKAAKCNVHVSNKATNGTISKLFTAAISKKLFTVAISKKLFTVAISKKLIFVVNIYNVLCVCVISYLQSVTKASHQRQKQRDSLTRQSLTLLWVENHGGGANESHGRAEAPPIALHHKLSVGVVEGGRRHDLVLRGATCAQRDRQVNSTCQEVR